MLTCLVLITCINCHRDNYIFVTLCHCVMCFSVMMLEVIISTRDYPHFSNWKLKSTKTTVRFDNSLGTPELTGSCYMHSTDLLHKSLLTGIICDKKHLGQGLKKYHMQSSYFLLLESEHYFWHHCIITLWEYCPLGKLGWVSVFQIFIMASLYRHAYIMWLWLVSTSSPFGN